MNNTVLEFECVGMDNGGKFPIEYTGRGQDISPEFIIKNLSPNAETLAVILEDLSHPIKDFTHWIICVVFQIKRAANLQIILAPYKIDVVLQPHYPETLLHITRTKILPCKLIAQEYSVSSYENGSSSSSIWQA